MMKAIAMESDIDRQYVLMAVIDHVAKTNIIQHVVCYRYRRDSLV